MKIETWKVIEVQDWDHLVETTYKKPYRFQQQNGCRERGIFTLEVTDDPDASGWGYENDTVTEQVNGTEKGVSFKAWLARDPKQPVGNDADTSSINSFWERNFYPNIEVVAHDLCVRGLLEKGTYHINIDW